MHDIISEITPFAPTLLFKVLFVSLNPFSIQSGLGFVDLSFRLFEFTLTQTIVRVAFELDQN